MAYTVGSLCAGIGGFDLAFEWAGFQIKWQVEIDDYCNKILEKHWPNVARYKDLKQCGATNLAAVDVVAGGIPCQPTSQAGKRLGENDPRWLWPDAIRIVQEIQPEAVLFENVAGLRTLNDGRAFREILRCFTKIGYDAEWHHLRASDFGAPHRRERIFIVAYPNKIGRSTERAEREVRGRLSAALSSGTMENTNSKGSGPRRPEFEGQQREPSPIESSNVAYSTSDDSRFRFGLGDSTIEDGNGGTSATDSGSPMGDTTIEGLSQRGYATFPTSETQSGAGMVDQLERSGGVGQADAKESGLESIIGKSPYSRPPNRSSASQSESTGATQPILGRAVDGLPRWLDGTRWPAGPGEQQYEWEAPRIASGVKNRVARLKALGNAVVPQVVYPLAVIIREYLDG